MAHDHQNASDATDQSDGNGFVIYEIRCSRLTTFCFMLWQIRIASPIAEAVSIVGRAFSGHI
jgi:hypothetical protein